jgi:uncharacterized protein YgiM (DUF1202 family)
MKYTYIILMLLTSAAISSPAQNCKELQPDAEEIFQELAYEGGLACMYSTIENSKYVTIRFFEQKLGYYNEIASNSSLLQLEDMQTYQPVLDTTSEGHFQLTHQFPRDTYVVELARTGQSIETVGIYKSIKLNAATYEGTPHIVEFAIKKTKLNSMPFDTLTLDKAFDKETLELDISSIGKTVPISAERAMLFSKPSAQHKSNAYLIKGDIVSLLKAKDKWLFVRYTTKEKTLIERWIMLSDIL